MRRSRILAWITAAALVCSLAVMPAGAYTDLDEPRWSWAVADIASMTARGLLRGYDDGTFSPGSALPVIQALTVAARLRVPDEALRAQIGRDRQEEIEALVGSGASWFWNEAATCVEAGIISLEELEDICGEGRLYRPLPLEEFAVYIGRAIGLEPLTGRLKSAQLSFADAEQVSEAARPFVYLLSVHAILRGNTENRLNPQVPINRAQTAAILARAVKYVELNRVSLELTEYTTYDWTAGTVAELAPGEGETVLLTLANDRGEEETLTCGPEVVVYQNDQIAEDGFAVVKTGTYARVGMDEDGAPALLRLSGKVETVSGAIAGLTEKWVTVETEEGLRRFAIDRFTQVRAGGELGDRTLIDPEEGYTTAVCGVDELGSLVRLELGGIDRLESGVLSGIARRDGGGYTLTVCALDGKPTRYEVSDTAEITVNGEPGLLEDGFAGVCGVTLRLANRSGEVLGVEVDTTVQRHQGVIRVLNGEPSRSVIISDPAGTIFAEYRVASDAVVAYMGVVIGFDRLARDWYVTLETVNGVVVRADAYPAYTITTGTVDGAVAFDGDTALVKVLRENGETEQFELDLDALPSIKRDGTRSSVEKLKPGDDITVTARYYRPILVEALSHKTTVLGVLQRKVEERDGVSLELLPYGSEETVTYLIPESASVTQDGAAATLSSVRVGSHISLVLDAGEPCAVEALGMEDEPARELHGKVLYINLSERTVLLLLSGGDQATAEVPERAILLDVTTGQQLTLEELLRGDTLQLHGNWTGQTFKPATILRK